MARGGNNRKPIPIRQAQGNPGKRPIPEAIPEPPEATSLRAPSELDKYGQIAWRRNVKRLKTMRVLTEADLDVLMLYCQAYSRWRSGNEQLSSLDPIDKDYRSVAVTVEKAEGVMRAIAEAFGMTPRARAGLSVKPAEVKDAFSEMFDGNRASG